MSKRYRVSQHPEVASFTYPADPISLRAVHEAGGVSQMSPEERAKLKFKSVYPGDDCSDMPQPALGIYIARRWVEEVRDEVRKS